MPMATLQPVSWMLQPMRALMAEHLNSLAKYAPLQGGKSFAMSNPVDEFIKKARQ
jgi:arylsulfatase